MAFRGRGRGRGYGGGGGFRVAKQEPFILFPDISENLTDAKTVNEEVNLAIYGSRLQKFWNSLYYFDEEKTETVGGLLRNEAGRVERSRRQSGEPLSLTPEILPIRRDFPLEALTSFESSDSTKDQSFDIKRLSDLGKRRGKPKKELPNTILRTSEYVPAELARVSKLEQRGQKKVRWNPESGLMITECLDFNYN
ncbi:unnamed protein product [Ilex paraguariensis]|uniref:Uncharacterized protein n=1 Tax=Ilex paraguariensis TaxID=185542 RepID=A0ABC8TYF9_9AQUA